MRSRTTRHSGPMMLGCLQVGALVLLLVVSGCNGPVGIEGRRQLAQAQQQYNDGQYTLAVQTLDHFLEQYPRAQEVGQAYYLRGLSNRELGPGKLALAERDFQLASQRGATAELQALAQVALGHIFFERGREAQAQAIAPYQAALENLPAAPPRDVVLYRLAVVLQQQGRWSEANSYLSQCFTHFPNSSVADVARTRFGASAFSIQVGAFSTLTAAQAKVEQLRRHGVTAEWVGIQRDGRLLYAVRCGSYSDYAAAQAALPSVQAVDAKAMITTNGR